MKKMLLILILLPFVVKSQNMFFGQNGSGGAFTVQIETPSGDVFGIAGDSVSVKASRDNCYLYLIPSSYSGDIDNAVTIGLGRKVLGEFRDTYYPISVDGFDGDYSAYAKDPNGWKITSNNDVTVLGVGDDKIVDYRTSTADDYDYILISGEVKEMNTITGEKGIYLQDTIGLNNGIFISDESEESELSRDDAVELLCQIQYDDEYGDAIVYAEFLAIQDFIADDFDTDPDTITTMADGNVHVINRIVGYTAGATSSGLTAMIDGTDTVYVSNDFYSFTLTQGSDYDITGVGIKTGITTYANSYEIRPRDSNDIDAN